MTDYPSIDRLAQLQRMIGDFARIERVPHLADLGRPENDVEHSYGLALTCWFLHPKIAPELDMLKIFKYALAHDLVEIHAGDTFAFGPDKAHIDSKEERERDAIQQLRLELDDFTEPVDFAEGYMDKADDEATFVKAVDKMLPLLMIGQVEKKAYWAKHGINERNLKANKQAIKLTRYTEPYFDLIFEWLETNGELPKQ